MPQILIALGSNLGDSRKQMADAVARLREEMEVLAVSPAYETEPMYVEDQPVFLNAALLAQTNRSPRGVLTLLKQIEVEIGRLPRTRNGPREIDLDLVAYGALAYAYKDKTTQLQLPHPRTPERRFVLLPCSDVAPDFLLPGLGRISDLLNKTETQANDVRQSGPLMPDA